MTTTTNDPRTLAEWQATRRICPNLVGQDGITDIPGHDEGVAVPGLLYHGGYIEEPNAGPGKRYYLCIERSEWESDDLEKLERRLWDWVRTEWLDQPNHSDELAEEFVKVLRASLTSAQWDEMVSLNQTADYSTACASHNYCDANDAMFIAFKKVVGRELFQSEDGSVEHAQDTDLLNVAWDMARERHMGTPKVEG